MSERKKVKRAWNEKKAFHAGERLCVDRERGCLQAARGLGPFAGGALLWRGGGGGMVHCRLRAGGKCAQYGEIVGVRQYGAGAQPETDKSDKTADNPVAKLGAR